MFTFIAELTGVTPLLMHADDIEAGDTVTAARKAMKGDRAAMAEFKNGDDRFPASTWKSYLYHDGTHIALPGENVLKCLSHAGKSIPRGRGSNYSKIVQSSLTYPSTHFEFYGRYGRISMEDIHQATAKINDVTGFQETAKAVAPLGIKLWAKRAVVGTAKHVRVRPRFDHWRATIELTVVTEDFDEKTITRMFDLAGMYSGLGDWRPSAPRAAGPYGKFTAKLSF